MSEERPARRDGRQETCVMGGEKPVLKKGCDIPERCYVLLVGNKYLLRSVSLDALVHALVRSRYHELVHDLVQNNRHNWTGTAIIKLHETVVDVCGKKTA